MHPSDIGWVGVCNHLENIGKFAVLQHLLPPTSPSYPARTSFEFHPILVAGLTYFFSCAGRTYYSRYHGSSYNYNGGGSKYYHGGGGGGYYGGGGGGGGGGSGLSSLLQQLLSALGGLNPAFPLLQALLPPVGRPAGTICFSDPQCASLQCVNVFPMAGDALPSFCA